MVHAPERTKMVAPESKHKIKLVRDCMIGQDIRKEGEVVEVDEATAKELCDTVFSGPTQFRGERASDDPSAGPARIVRAVRVQ